MEQKGVALVVRRDEEREGVKKHQWGKDSAEEGHPHKRRKIQSLPNFSSTKAAAYTQRDSETRR